MDKRVGKNLRALSIFGLLQHGTVASKSIDLRQEILDDSATVCELLNRQAAEVCLSEP